jgi:hypothetical protein
MACLAIMVRQHGLSLDDEYVHIKQFVFNADTTSRYLCYDRPLSFFMKCHIGDIHSNRALLRTLLTLRACPNVPVHHIHSCLYYALTSSKYGLDAAQLLLDFGASLDPALDGGIMYRAVHEHPSLERHHRLISLFEFNRPALRGLENVHATVKDRCEPITEDGDMYEVITTDVGVLHELVRVYAEEGTEQQDHAHIESITATFRGLHTRVGVSLLMPGRSVFLGYNVPALPVLEYVRALHQQALDLDDDANKQRCARFQRLIDVIEPLDRAERWSLRPLATAAELSLKWSPIFGALSKELRRMILGHVLSWNVQPRLVPAVDAAVDADGVAAGATDAA